MRKLGRMLYLLIAVVAVSCAAGVAQQRSTGIFAGSTDIGAIRPGSTIYLPADAAHGDEYRVTGGGADMWGAADAFHLSWVRLQGDTVFNADVLLPANGIPALAKAVLIFRQTLDPGSPYVDAAIHGDGHITTQYRNLPGGKTEDTTATVHGAPGNWTRLRIERRGNTFTVSAGPADGASNSTADNSTLLASEPVTVKLHGPVYVGIGVCAHSPDGLATVTFANVRIVGGSTPASNR
jgi:TolB protein